MDLRVRRVAERKHTAKSLALLLIWGDPGVGATGSVARRPHKAPSLPDWQASEPTHEPPLMETVQTVVLHTGRTRRMSRFRHGDCYLRYHAW